MLGDLLKDYLATVSHAARLLPIDRAETVVQHILEAYQRQATVFICGNGGSAATASHFACDLAKGAASTRGRPIRALALTDPTPLLTAWANDCGYETVFAEQLAVHAQPGDIVIAISTSGRSPNVIRAVEFAQTLNLTTIGFTGCGDSPLARRVDEAVSVPGTCIEAIEDVHAMLCHAISIAVRRALADQGVAPVRDLLRPAIFCDRDGVLNVLRPDHVKTWREFDFMPGALEALAELARVQAPVVLITNQSVIGRGLTPATVVEEIHRRMLEQIRAHSGPDMTIYMCPHAPEAGCTCRKPQPGLLLQAAADLGLELSRSVLIGDSLSDVDAALAAGCRAILIGRHAASTCATLPGTVTCVPTLSDAVRMILADPTFKMDAHCTGSQYP
jgi:histidinol-phosphate phosphatase family protein